ncbi:MAG: helix-turn-helix domain-containing protein [Campylobacteraceae bacterium]|jgi:transcriptional regulator with XRE-family HTH domain|nr:helix-turn-helix domain-containing protein [Campylobacteraceae bacterium]
MKKIKQIDIARKLGATHSAVSQWFAGKTRPSIPDAFIIQECFGIPAIAWVDIKSFITDNDTKSNVYFN